MEAYHHVYDWREKQVMSKVSKCVGVHVVGIVVVMV